MQRVEILNTQKMQEFFLHAPFTSLPRHTTFRKYDQRIVFVNTTKLLAALFYFYDKASKNHTSIKILWDLLHFVLCSPLNCFTTYLFTFSITTFSITTFSNIQQKNSPSHRRCEFRHHLSSQNMLSDFKYFSPRTCTRKMKMNRKASERTTKKSFPP